MFFVARKIKQGVLFVARKIKQGVLFVAGKIKGIFVKKNGKEEK